MTEKKKPAQMARRSLPRHAALLASAVAGGIAFPLALLIWPGAAVAIAANAMFGTYLALTLYEAPCLTPKFLRRRAADTDAPVGMIFTVAVLAVSVAMTFLFLALNEKTIDPIGLALNIVSVLLGWFTIHAMAGLHYAYEYYERPETSADGDGVVGGLEFPAGDEPDGWAFLYFSFVIGMTAQVADIAVSSNAMRRRVLLHGVFSFLFNTVIVAATVNAVLSLAGTGGS